MTIARVWANHCPSYENQRPDFTLMPINSVVQYYAWLERSYLLIFVARIVQCVRVQQVYSPYATPCDRNEWYSCVCLLVYHSRWLLAEKLLSLLTIQCAVDDFSNFQTTCHGRVPLHNSSRFQQTNKKLKVSAS